MQVTMYEVTYDLRRKAGRRTVVVMACLSTDAVSRATASDPEYDPEAYTTSKRLPPDTVIQLRTVPV